MLSVVYIISIFYLTISLALQIENLSLSPLTSSTQLESKETEFESNSNS